MNRSVMDATNASGGLRQRPRIGTLAIAPVATKPGRLGRCFEGGICKKQPDVVVERVDSEAVTNQAQVVDRVTLGFNRRVPTDDGRVARRSAVHVLPGGVLATALRTGDSHQSLLACRPGLPHETGSASGTLSSGVSLCARGADWTLNSGLSPGANGALRSSTTACGYHGENCEAVHVMPFAQRAVDANQYEYEVLTLKEPRSFTSPYARPSA